MEHLIDRAMLLMQHERYAEAQNALKDILSQDPNNVYALTLMAQVYLNLDNLKEAEECIQSAIAISPDDADLYYVKSRIHLQKNEYDIAEKMISESIELDPNESAYFAHWSFIKLMRKQYVKALELADDALALNPENILALNNRSTALIKLDRKDEAYTTISGALEEDPNNAYTHANYGWNLLEKGEHEKALVHFQEALKNDPNLEYAKDGMGEAIKAKNFLYRWFLNYAFWMSNLTSKYQWGVIIAFFLVYKVLNAIATRNENLKVFILPILILMAVFAMSTWIITPISNLFLRLNKYGKYVLSKNDTMSANLVGLSLLVCLIGVLLYFTQSNDNYLSIILFGFTMMIPLGVVFYPTKIKHILPIYTACMFMLGVLGIMSAFQTNELFNGAFSLYFIGLIAFQWGANFIFIQDNNP